MIISVADTIDIKHLKRFLNSCRSYSPLSEGKGGISRSAVKVQTDKFIVYAIFSNRFLLMMPDPFQR